MTERFVIVTHSEDQADIDNGSPRIGELVTIEAGAGNSLGFVKVMRLATGTSWYVLGTALAHLDEVAS